jgi:hypothetical protein
MGLYRSPAMEISPEFPDRPVGGRVFSEFGMSSGVTVAVSSRVRLGLS